MDQQSKPKKLYMKTKKIYIWCGCRHLQYKNDICFNIIMDVYIRNTKMTSISTLLRMSTSAMQSRWGYYVQKFWHLGVLEKGLEVQGEVPYRTDLVKPNFNIIDKFLIVTDLAEHSDICFVFGFYPFIFRFPFFNCFFYFFVYFCFYFFYFVVFVFVFLCLFLFF